MDDTQRNRARLPALIVEAARVTHAGTRLDVVFWLWPSTPVVDITVPGWPPGEHLTCADAQDAADELALALGHVQADLNAINHI